MYSTYKLIDVCFITSQCKQVLFIWLGIGEIEILLMFPRSICGNTKVVLCMVHHPWNILLFPYQIVLIVRWQLCLFLGAFSELDWRSRTKMCLLLGLDFSLFWLAFSLFLVCVSQRHASSNKVAYLWFSIKECNFWSFIWSCIILYKSVQKTCCLIDF